MTKVVYLISGFKNAGKDTTADVLGGMLDSHLRLEYASNIKSIASTIFGVPYEVLAGKTPENRAKREEIIPFWSDYIPGLTGRKTLTLLGTDIIRKHLLDEIWSLSTIESIVSMDYPNAIVSDLRDPRVEETLAREILPSYGYEVVSIRVQGGHEPPWLDDAHRAFFNNDNEAIQRLTDIDVHVTEWVQVGLQPDYTITNHKMETLEEAQEAIYQQLLPIISQHSK